MSFGFVCVLIPLSMSLLTNNHINFVIQFMSLFEFVIYYTNYGLYRLWWRCLDKLMNVILSLLCSVCTFVYMSCDDIAEWHLKLLSQSFKERRLLLTLYTIYSKLNVIRDKSCLITDIFNSLLCSLFFLYPGLVFN